MQSGESDSARVAAANALLDRGYGRPNLVIEAEITVRKLSDAQLEARIFELIQPKPLALLPNKPTGTEE
ncbi:MAG: hypothetical protein H0W34_14085 [Pyrinomonadaceae bacterium]|nr:hypothetical protein [Pyrinomonadaceae bacterium]